MRFSVIDTFVSRDAFSTSAAFVVAMTTTRRGWSRKTLSISCANFHIARNGGEIHNIFRKARSIRTGSVEEERVCVAAGRRDGPDKQIAYEYRERVNHCAMAKNHQCGYPSTMRLYRIAANSRAHAWA